LAGERAFDWVGGSVWRGAAFGRIILPVPPKLRLPIVFSLVDP